MPSLQDALQNALSKQQAPVLNSATLDAWEKDEQQLIEEKTVPNPNPRSVITNNVTRATFNCVRDNPGKTKPELIAMMLEQGFKRSSVESLLGQMVATKQLAKAPGKCYTTLVDEYQPINTRQLQEAREEKRKAPQRERALAALEKARAVRKEKALARKARAERKAAAAAQHTTAREEPKQKYQPKVSTEGIAALAPSLPVVELTADKILDTLGVRQAKLLYAELKKIFEE